MSNSDTDNEIIEPTASDEAFDNFDDGKEFDDRLIDLAAQEQAMTEAAIALVNELASIRAALNDRKQLAHKIDQLSADIFEQQQQSQKIISLLEQVTQILSSNNLSRLLAIQKEFGTFSQNLGILQQNIQSNLKQQRSTTEAASTIYQDLRGSWRRLEDEVAMLRRATNEGFSMLTLIMVSIIIGFSTAGFLVLAFKLSLIR
jgi:hypothetical protein